MSKTSRRLFLGAGSAAAVFGGLRVAAGALPLQALIDAHKAAHTAFDEICGYGDRVKPSDPRYPLLEAEWVRLRDAEDEAMWELCEFRPATMHEVRLRGDYLASFTKRNPLSPEECEALIESFRSRADATY